MKAEDAPVVGRSMVDGRQTRQWLANAGLVQFTTVGPLPVEENGIMHACILLQMQ